MNKIKPYPFTEISNFKVGDIVKSWCPTFTYKIIKRQKETTVIKCIQSNQLITVKNDEKKWYLVVN